MIEVTLEEAHKRLDEEYKYNRIVTLGNRRGRLPENIRVAGALIATAEIAKSECADLYFSIPKMKDGAE